MGRGQGPSNLAVKGAASDSPASNALRDVLGGLDDKVKSSEEAAERTAAIMRRASLKIEAAIKGISLEPDSPKNTSPKMVAAKRKSLVAECQGEGGGLSGDYWARLRAQFEEEDDGDSESEPGTPKAAEEEEEEGEASKEAKEE